MSLYIKGPNIRGNYEVRVMNTEELLAIMPTLPAARAFIRHYTAQRTVF